MSQRQSGPVDVADKSSVSTNADTCNGPVGVAKKSRSSTGPRHVTDRILKTACVFVSFCVMGLGSSILGNTAVHLERLFDVDTATMSMVFTAQSIGILIGSVMCGFIYDRVHRELSLTIACLVEGLALVLAPFIGGIGGLVAFIITICIQAAAQGFIDSSSQSYCVGMWAGSRLREPLLQAAHSLWSFGGVIGPLIVSRFLVELPQSAASNETQTSVTDNGWSIISSAPMTSSEEQPDGSTSTTDGDSVPPVNWNMTTVTTGFDDSSPIADVARVRYAYVTIGSIILVATVLFAVAFCRGRSRSARKAKKRVHRPPVDVVSVKLADDNSKDRPNDPLKPTSRSAKSRANKSSPSATSISGSVQYNRFVYPVFMILVFLFYHLYLYVEWIPIAFMTTFAVKYLKFPARNAAVITSVFFGFHFAGRLIGVPLSTCLRPRTMVVINVTLTAASYLLLLAFVNVWPAIVWLSSAMAGLSMATTFTNGILWTADRIPMTGRVASVMLVGSSLGGVIGPQFVGRLFDAWSPMWFVYTLVAASVSHAALFGFMLAFVRRFGEQLKRATAVDRLDDDDVRVTTSKG